MERMNRLMSLFSRLNVRIFLLSLWMLFLELFLIRWISTEIRVFAYVSNLVLLACFIGIGLGCYFAERKANLLFTFGFIAGLVLAGRSSPFLRITDFLSGFTDSGIWFTKGAGNDVVSVVTGVLLTISMFAMITGAFVPIGQLLGAMFNEHKKTILAYSVNIAGNLAGIWLFSFLSLAFTPPWVWLLISTLLGLLFVPRTGRDILISACLSVFALVLILVPMEDNPLVIWTPYQKLTMKEKKIGGILHGYDVGVNNVRYMRLLPVAGSFYFAHYRNVQQFESAIIFNQYELPYILKGGADDVLIVGSGGGNDVSGALLQGAKSVDAVEIDPGIYQLGYFFHPEKPYQDKRVNIFIDDARSFFKKTERRYDVVSFGLLDSHATSSQYNNIRMDHYVYTLESLREAKRLLKPDGLMVVVFDAKQEWLSSRIYLSLTEVFGREPLAFLVGDPALPYLGGTMYVAASNPKAILENIGRDRKLQEYVLENKVGSGIQEVRLTTDDWPYLYLEKASIPAMYLCVILSLLIVFIAGAKALFLRTASVNMHFFFLGAAFMLLEFQNISKSALLFGSTWIVNAYMITAILILILVANLVAYRLNSANIRPFYYLLLASVVAIFLIPLDRLNIPNHFLKATLIALFLNIPIFFAGIVFINSFARFEQKNLALGSNLLGAALGGLMESVSFVVGIKALLVLVFVFYALSYVFGKRGQVFK
jgi:spermidine synthase